MQYAVCSEGICSMQILVGATETAGRPSEEATYCLQAQADRLSLVVALGRIVIATIW